MMKKDRDYVMFLEDILESAERIEEYTRDFDKNSFFLDWRASDATMRRFEIIGEATNHIPPKVKKEYPEIDWKGMIGFRNVLIHEYFGFNKDKLWRTVKNDIPDLRNKMAKVLTEINKQEKNHTLL